MLARLRERSEYSPTRRGQTSRGTPIFCRFLPRHLHRQIPRQTCFYHDIYSDINPTSFPTFKPTFLAKIKQTGWLVNAHFCLYQSIKSFWNRDRCSNGKIWRPRKRPQPSFISWLLIALNMFTSTFASSISCNFVRRS